MKRLGWTDALGRAPSSARVLIVEDEADVRKSLERLVARFGYTARGAASAEAADQWMNSERFDVCLLDIELPRMKGVEFLDWALSRDPEMAVIMMTGVDVPEIAVKCIEHGARTYLVKPVEMAFLRLALKDALAMRALLVERNDMAGAV
jgi:DNA-binding NtrC family response regulator